MIERLGVFAERYWLWWVLGVALFKLSLAAWLPLTGDEAYFAAWGLELAFGYYDHPPMAGWMMAVMQLVGDHPVILRFPGMVTGFILAAVFWWVLRPFGRERAGIMALVILISPISLINVFTLTDTGVILFSGLSIAAIIPGLNNQKYHFFVLSGFFLGLAFLSKYFAALLVFAYAVYFFLIDRSLWRYGLVILFSSLPFALINLYWNYTHCWTNVLFNFFNRHDAGGFFDLQSFSLYVLTVVYVFLPPVLIGIFRLFDRRFSVSKPLAHLQRLALTVLAFSLLIFAVVSLRRPVGLHWLLWLHVFAVIALWPLVIEQWRRLAGALVLWSIGHVLLLPTIFALVLVYASSDEQLQRDWVALTHTNEIFEAVRTQVDEVLGKDVMGGDLRIATGSYSSAAIAQHRTRMKVHVFGTGSRYGRQDDFWTDFTILDGTDWLIFTKDAPRPKSFEPFFASIYPIAVSVEGQKFHFILGNGLDSLAYQKKIIASVLDRYYSLPAWLPTGECSMKARYE